LVGRCQYRYENENYVINSKKRREEKRKIEEDKRFAEG